VNDLTIGLISALLATNQPQAVSNLVQQQTGVSVSIVNPDDPAEKELKQLMIEDDAALDEVDKWIRDNDTLVAEGGGETKAVLKQRIQDRLDVVRKHYDDFLKRNPDFARGHMAYGSFLNDIGEEEAAAGEFEKASKLDPKNPAAWNNLANYYGEYGELTNAFGCYARAIDLDPTEPVYYQNLATTVYLFRKDAEAFYGINEQQVFDKALELYRKAVKLDPENFALAADYAETYYGIRPLRTNDALVAWTNALNVAGNEIEREGIYIHLARVKLGAGRFDEARTHLAAVTNSFYADTKNRLARNLAEREKAATNSVPQEQLEIPTNNPAPKLLNR
jgi:tetratricopeptide (TPR) repeat protein